MFCSKCGNVNPDNSKFCRSCGAPNADAGADFFTGAECHTPPANNGFSPSTPGTQNNPYQQRGYSAPSTAIHPRQPVRPERRDRVIVRGPQKRQRQA